MPRSRETKRRGGRDLCFVKVSALHDAWGPKKRRKIETKKFGFFVKFDSIDSIIGSIRSIMRSVGVVDRPVDADVDVGTDIGVPSAQH